MSYTSISIMSVSSTWCLTLAINFWEASLAVFCLLYNIIIDGVILLSFQVSTKVRFYEHKVKNCQQAQVHIQAFDNWAVKLSGYFWIYHHWNIVQNFKCDHFEARYNVTWYQKWMTPNWFDMSTIHRKYNQHTTHIYILIFRILRSKMSNLARISNEDWLISSNASIPTKRKKSIFLGFSIKFKITSSARLRGVKLSSFGILILLKYHIVYNTLYTMFYLYQEIHESRKVWYMNVLILNPCISL